MTLDLAMRASECLLGFALLQQSLEHMHSFKPERLFFAPRAVLSLLLIAGIVPALICSGLVMHGIFMLHRFQGPYNGGSDRMSLLVLSCLWLMHMVEEPLWQAAIFAYLALQLTLSYFISGWVKIINPDWRNGRALKDVMRFSAYPACEDFRALAARPKLLKTASLLVIWFELLFPLALASQPSLWAALGAAFMFHLANMYFFGLNRFVWAWLSAYPSLLWVQQILLSTI